MKKVSTKTYPSDLYNNYIDSLLAVVSGEYPSHPVITVNISNRLFDLGCKNNKYLGKIKDVLSAFDIKYDMDDKSPRLWGMYLLLIINNKRFFTQDEARIVMLRISSVCSCFYYVEYAESRKFRDGSKIVFKI